MRKRLLENKEGQLKISFGMIFSIFLIVVFLAFAFMGINRLLSTNENVLIGKFVSEFSADVETVWKSNEVNQIYSYKLPGKVKGVCILDSESSGSGSGLEFYDDLMFEVSSIEENLFFYPPSSSGNLGGSVISYVDMGQTTLTDNPLCIKVNDGEVDIKLIKTRGNPLVIVERV